MAHFVSLKCRIAKSRKLLRNYEAFQRTKAPVKSKKWWSDRVSEKKIWESFKKWASHALSEG